MKDYLLKDMVKFNNEEEDEIRDDGDDMSVTVFSGQSNRLEKTTISPGNGAKLKNVRGIIIHTRR